MFESGAHKRKRSGNGVSNDVFWVWLVSPFCQTHNALCCWGADGDGVYGFIYDCAAKAANDHNHPLANVVGFGVIS